MTVRTGGSAHVNETLGLFTDKDAAVACARKAVDDYADDFQRDAVNDITVRESDLRGNEFDLNRGPEIWSAVNEGILAWQQ